MPTPLVQTANVYTVAVSVLNGSELQFSPDPCVVSLANSLITFKLVTPGYMFPVDGTALVINNPGTEFPIAWYIDPTTIGLADYNNNVASYSYTMTVQNISSGARVSDDPGIDNDNHK